MHALSPVPMCMRSQLRTIELLRACVLYTDFVLLRAEAHRAAVVAAGALPALVSALASSMSEATREHCAIAMGNISIGGAWCCLRQRTVDPGV